MSHFYVSAEGQAGETTRAGSKRSGIHAHPRGWKTGVRVSGYHTDAGDFFEIRATEGSSGYGPDRPIATILPDGTVLIDKAMSTKAGRAGRKA